MADIVVEKEIFYKRYSFIYEDHLTEMFWGMKSLLSSAKVKCGGITQSFKRVVSIRITKCLKTDNLMLIIE